MSQDTEHKFEAKAKQGLLNWSDAPANLKKKWDRHNFDGGRQKSLRIAKKIKSLQKSQDI